MLELLSKQFLLALHLVSTNNARLDLDVGVASTSTELATISTLRPRRSCCCLSCFSWHHLINWLDHQLVIHSLQASVEPSLEPEQVWSLMLPGHHPFGKVLIPCRDFCIRPAFVLGRNHLAIMTHDGFQPVQGDLILWLVSFKPIPCSVFDEVESHIVHEANSCSIGTGQHDAFFRDLELRGHSLSPAQCPF